jgi:hypothetical protein
MQGDGFSILDTKHFGSGPSRIGPIRFKTCVSKPRPDVNYLAPKPISPPCAKFSVRVATFRELMLLRPSGANERHEW